MSSDSSNDLLGQKTWQYIGRTIGSISTAMSCTFVIIGGGISGVSCAEYLSLLCPKETITLITAADVVKATCNFKQFGRTLEEFDVEEKAASVLFKQSRNVIIVQSVVTAFSPKGMLLYIMRPRGVN